MQMVLINHDVMVHRLMGAAVAPGAHDAAETKNEEASNDGYGQVSKNSASSKRFRCFTKDGLSVGSIPSGPSTLLSTIHVSRRTLFNTNFSTPSSTRQPRERHFLTTPTNFVFGTHVGGEAPAKSIEGSYVCLGRRTHLDDRWSWSPLA